jgi:predicted dehydrogenase
MLNDGVHHFDLWHDLLDTQVVQVCANSMDSPEFEDDTCTVSARFANGALASAVFSFATSANSQLEFFGERGSLLLSLYRFDGLVFTPYAELPGSLGSHLRRATGFVRSFPAALSSLRYRGDFNATYDGLWRHFAACVRDDEIPACGLAHGRASVAVARACLESVYLGRTVSLE